MDNKPGWKTTEFWVTSLGSIVLLVIQLLVSYQLLTAETAELWGQLALAVVNTVIPVVVGVMVKSYAEGRVAVKTAVVGGVTPR